MKTGNSSGKVILVVVIIILLLAIGGYFWWKNKDKPKVITEEGYGKINNKAGQSITKIAGKSEKVTQRKQERTSEANKVLSKAQIIKNKYNKESNESKREVLSQQMMGFKEELKKLGFDYKADSNGELYLIEFFV